MSLTGVVPAVRRSELAPSSVTSTDDEVTTMRTRVATVPYDVRHPFADDPPQQLTITTPPHPPRSISAVIPAAASTDRALASSPAKDTSRTPEPWCAHHEAHRAPAVGIGDLITGANIVMPINRPANSDLTLIAVRL